MGCRSTVEATNSTPQRHPGPRTLPSPKSCAAFIICLVERDPTYARDGVRSGGYFKFVILCPALLSPPLTTIHPSHFPYTEYHAYHLHLNGSLTISSFRSKALVFLDKTNKDIAVDAILPSAGVGCRHHARRRLMSTEGNRLQALYHRRFLFPAPIPTLPARARTVSLAAAASLPTLCPRSRKMPTHASAAPGNTASGNPTNLVSTSSEARHRDSTTTALLPTPAGHIEVRSTHTESESDWRGCWQRKTTVRSGGGHCEDGDEDKRVRRGDDAKDEEDKEVWSSRGGVIETTERWVGLDLYDQRTNEEEEEAMAHLLMSIHASPTCAVFTIVLSSAVACSSSYLARILRLSQTAPLRLSSRVAASSFESPGEALPSSCAATAYFPVPSLQVSSTMGKAYLAWIVCGVLMLPPVRNAGIGIPNTMTQWQGGLGQGRKASYRGMTRTPKRAGVASSGEGRENEGITSIENVAGRGADEGERLKMSRVRSRVSPPPFAILMVIDIIPRAIPTATAAPSPSRLPVHRRKSETETPTSSKLTTMR
ncbi:hypothetical protein R3P38DRAFT_3167908 [Favolaschia claudopus]|uniref:Uncharacterized protein n=1 Tax=Favolaschia claudopus TaxID=2862362 RepID=A0AAW0E665_9AGAR